MELDRCVGDVRGIEVDPDEQPAGLEPRQDLAGVPSETERAVDDDLTRLGVDHFEHLPEQDGDVKVASGHEKSLGKTRATTKGRG